VSKQTCIECRREYAVSEDERRRRGDAVDTLCARCQVAAAHDAWGERQISLGSRVAA
jgi:hypothetical protein